MPEDISILAVAPDDELVSSSNSSLPSAAISLDIGTDRMRIGSGFNAFTGEPGGQAVAFDEAEELEQVASDAEGKRIQYSMKKVESLEELRKSLDVSVAASLGWGAFKGSSTYALTEQNFVSIYDVFVTIDVSVQLPALILRSKQLRQPAIDRIEAGYSAFLEFCGTCFIHGFVEGARITCLLRFSTKSEEHRRQVSASVSAKVSGFTASGSLAASFSQALSELKEHSELEIRMIRDGGVGPLPNMDLLITTCEAFPDTVTRETGSVVTTLLAQPYPTTDNWPLTEPTIQMSKLLDHGRKIQMVADSLIMAYEARSNAAYAKRYPSSFISSNEASVIDNAESAFEEANRIIRRLNAELDAHRANPDLPAIIPPTLTLMKVSRIEGTPVATPPPAPPPPAPKPIQLYEHADFGGRCVEIDEAITDLNSVSLNDQLSSIRVGGKAAQYRVTLFQNSNFTGTKLVLTGPCEVKNLGKKIISLGYSYTTLNDQVSSLLLEKLY